MYNNIAKLIISYHFIMRNLQMVFAILTTKLSNFHRETILKYYNNT